MKTITIFFISLLTLTGNLLLAQQAKLVTSGTIEYEKSVNTFAVNRLLVAMQSRQMQPMYSQSLDNYEKRGTQFLNYKSTLTFDNRKTLFVPDADDNTPIKTAALLATNTCKQLNTVYTDVSASTRTVQKDIYNEQFLLKDSLNKIKWRIIGGSQDVAGYTCREAHGVMQDSIYVVAFYTDKIRVSSGPESFSGLPGMILKLVLPHEHITWTATKITEGPPATAIVPPKKGTPITSKQLNELLNNNIRRRGVTGIYDMKLFLL